MITILFHITIKEGKEEEFHNLAARMTKISRGEDGCLDYTFLRQQGQPREYVLYERWTDEKSLFDHLDNLVELLGPCAPDEKIPAAFLDLCEKTQPFFYDVVPPSEEN